MGARSTTPGSHGRAAALVAALLAALLLSGCAASESGTDDSTVSAGDVIPESDADAAGASMSHVHGIGRNPGDGDVYVATHHGLWRVGEGGEPALVGGYLHDFMGFAVVGPDRFVASGHPNSADELPAHLGLIESTDGGRSWRSRSLLGDADFHALRVVDDTTYGWNSQDGALMTSEDGRTWQTLVDGVLMLDVAAHPTGGGTLVASVAKDRTTLELQRSVDSGSAFEAVAGAPELARFAWPEPDALWGFALDGTVWKSKDEGESWERVGSVEAMPDAVAGTPDELLAAAGGKVLASTDAGRSWQQVARYG